MDIKQEVIIKINKNKPDLVFQCRKCGHELFIDKIKFFKNPKLIMITDCPECGEEGYINWILADENKYEKH